MRSQRLIALREDVCERIGSLLVLTTIFTCGRIRREDIE